MQQHIKPTTGTNLNYVELTSALQAIIKVCSQMQAADQFQVNTEAVKPYFEQLAKILIQLKDANPAMFESIATPNISSFRTDSKRSDSGCLSSLRAGAEYCLTYVENSMSHLVSDENNLAYKTVLRVLQRFSSAIDRVFRSKAQPPLLRKIENEKELQEVLHCFLQLHFDDIRKEEAVPSHGGANSFIDFLLKPEGIGIEVKGPRDGLKDLKAGGELLEDLAKYENHPDCKILFIFLYDPEHQLSNPQGIINDLESKTKPGFKVKVVIIPPRH